MTEDTRAYLLRFIEYTRDLRLETEGGYPAAVDGDTVPGYVIVADVDHDQAPKLDIYDWVAIETWFTQAIDSCAQDLAACCTELGVPDEDEEFEVLWDYYNNVGGFEREKEVWRDIPTTF